MRLLRLLIVLAVAGTTARAQTNTPTAAPESRAQVVSVQDCIQLALQNNLDLKIDRFAPEIAVYTLQLDYAGYDPTFSISGSYAHNEQGVQLFGTNQLGSTITDRHSFNNGGPVLTGLLPWGLAYQLNADMSDTDLRVGSGSPAKSTASGVASVQLTQPLLKNAWIDTTRLNIRVDKNRLKHSEQVMRQDLIATVTQVEQAYFDLIYDRENVTVQQEAVALAEELASENKKKEELGAMTILDEQQADSQAATARAQWIASKSTLAVQEHLMKQLIGADYSSLADVQLEPSAKLTAVPQAFDRKDSWGKGLTLRPEIVQYKLDLEKAGLQLKYDRNQILPELDLVGTYGYNGAGTVFSDALYDIQQMNHSTYSIGAQLSIPLGNIKARNTVKSDKLSLEQALMTVKKQERDIMKAIDDDIANASSDYEQVSATRAAREYAELALSAEQTKLENGKSTTYTVLQMQNTLTSARGAEIQALDNYNKALSQLSSDEGSTLERLGIKLDVR